MQKTIKTFFLTCWVKDITQEQIKLKLEFLECDKLIIGAIEKTEKDLEHFHVLGCLHHSIRFDNFKCIVGDTTHIEQVGRVSNAFNYVQKEGCYYNDFDDYISTDDIYSSIINDILFGLSFQDIIKKYPKFALSHYQNLKSIYMELNK